MEKINYQIQMEKIIKDIQKENLSSKPKLLLHACCGPCSSYVIESLSSIFEITIYFYNPNIHPKTEYDRRLNELQNFLKIFPQSVSNKVKIIVDEYNPDEYFESTNVLNEPELQTEKEKGLRCFRCYKFRMKKSWDYALQNNFDFFTTTLSISPHKDSQKINQIGKELELSKNDCSNQLKFLYSDFKKKGGFLRSTQLTSEFKMWRQEYCGCIYSMRKTGETYEKK